jgi:SpoIID/LytB domain protein
MLRVAVPVMAVLLAAPVAARAGVSAGPPAERLVAPVAGEFHFEGHGFGHGRGMSQWGAQGAASHGIDHKTILSTYYPGTDLVRSDEIPQIRVHLSGLGSDALRVVAGPGMQLLTIGRTTPLPQQLDDQKVTDWRVRSVDGALQLEGLTDGWHRVGPRSAAGDPVELRGGDDDLQIVRGQELRQYRGALRVFPGDRDGQVAVVNVVDIESYLRSVVPSESPAYFEPAALQAQAVAARTYALWHAAHASADAVSDICDTTACQVYRGVRTLHRPGGTDRRWENSRTDAAVADTAGEQLNYNGKPALTEFSDSNGGWSTAGNEPYLPSRPDPWDGLVPNQAHSWTYTLNAARLQQAWPQIGRPTGLAAAQRDGDGAWGGRVLSVRVVGDHGQVVVPGGKFDHAAGMRNSWWQLQADPSSLPTEIPTAPPATDAPLAVPPASPQPAPPAQPAAPVQPAAPAAEPPASAQPAAPVQSTAPTQSAIPAQPAAPAPTGGQGRAAPAVPTAAQPTSPQQPAATDQAGPDDGGDPAVNR